MSSGHIPQEHYEPSSNAEKWLESRLPMIGLSHHLNSFPTPKNLNWMWVFGGVLVVCLLIQIATGITLAMWYTPHVDHAFDSVEAITRDVNSGWWMRYVHANGASFFFVAVYLHIFRGIYYGSYKAPREILWIIGVLIFLLMMATAFLGYVLPWGQMSFWGATVITNLFSAIPLVGDNILTWLQGGFAIDNAALNRFFSLHYLLPFAIAGLVALHIWALHHVGNNNPTGVPVRNDSVATAKRDTVPFTPFYTVKDLFAIIVFLMIFAAFVFFMPNYLGHPDNYIRANNLSTPTHIVPEWYFLPFYAILRSIPDKLLGVVAMFASIAVLAILPWLDTSRTRSGSYRPVFRQFFWAFCVCCIALGYVGAKAPSDILFASSTEPQSFATLEEAEELRDQIVAADEDAVVTIEQVVEQHVNDDGIEVYEAHWEVVETTVAFRAIHLGQIMTIYYFLFFLVILPVIGLIERPRQPPETIEADFMARKGKRRSSEAGPEGASAAPAE